MTIRWKVTLAFAGTLAVVLVAVGALMYIRFEDDLTETLDRGLRSRAAEISALARRDPAGLAGAQPSAFEADESVAQVLAADGTVLAGTRGATAVPLHAPVRREVLADRHGDRVLDEGIRLLAQPLPGGRTLLVGSSLDERDEALASLLALEAAGLAIALLLAGGAGYLVAGIALRPVDAMRREADAIKDRPDRRLPVPAVDDELGRLGTTLNAMLDRLAAAQERERRFVADAGHELRTPLTILKAELEVALLDGGTEDGLRAAVRSAGEETDRLIRLAEDLLLLAQADEAGVPLHPQTVDAAAVLGAAARRHRRQAGERAIEVDAPTGLAVQADRVRLDQVLGNLVDNALRHGAGDVLLTARATSNGVTLAVRDGGAGFGPELLERFARAGSGGGAGLGLAIVRAIAEAHGGQLSVEGAEVSVTLPAAHRSLIGERAS